MGITELFLVGVGLSMDAFAVAISAAQMTISSRKEEQL